LPSLSYEITQEIRRRGAAAKKRTLPKVGFFVEHRGGAFPGKALFRLKLAQGRKVLGPPSRHGHYDGTFVWNLNPGFGVNGWFSLPRRVMKNRDTPVRVRIDATLIAIFTGVNIPCCQSAMSMG
jgi:hypothetical protein